MRGKCCYGFVRIVIRARRGKSICADCGRTVHTWRLNAAAYRARQRAMRAMQRKPKPKPNPDAAILKKIAHALAWDMSVVKLTTPRQMYDAQTKGCQERFDEQAADMLKCFRRAGLVLTVRGRR